MRKNPEITHVGFKPPVDASLVLESMSINELLKRAPSDHFGKVQRADFYRLIGVLEGTTRPMVDFSTFAMQTGDWLLVQPGQVFRYDFSIPWTGLILVFRPDSLSFAPRSKSVDEINLLRHVEDLQSLHRLDQEQHHWIKRSLGQMQEDCTLTTNAVLRNDLLRLQLASTLMRLSLWQTHDITKLSGSSALEKFKRFRRRLEIDFSAHHQVQHYAKVLGISDKSLSRACIAAAGVSAKACIAQRLVLEAKRLLVHTHLTVQSLGLELGFDDATNFVKFFRRMTGTTPIAFRKKNTLGGH